MTAEPVAVRDVQETPTPRYLLSVAQTCESLSMGRSRIYELASTGELQTVRSGGRRLVVVASIEAYVAKLIDDEQYAASERRP